MKTEFKVVYTGIGDFERCIQNWLDDGWLLYGSPSFIESEFALLCYQAMTKEVP